MMLKWIRATVALVMICVLGGATHSALAFQEKTIKEYKSLYRNISVVEKNNWRCLRLKNKRNPFNSQSCKKLDKPQELLFFYSQAMMAVLSTEADGKKILSVGLGGGTMPTAIHSFFKSMDVTTVEIDPKMLTAAEEYMDFNQSPKNKVVTQDARFYIRKQKAKGVKYDVVMLDAFNGEYIPEHLTTKEFLTEVKSILKPGGLLLSNTFSFKDFYHSESVTYESVFPGFCTLRSSSARTIVAYADRMCDPNKLYKAVEAQLTSLASYIPNNRFLLKTINNVRDWNPDARIFTDQFSPANLYNQ